ncbi:MAG: NAD(P)-dependent glycerol-3-phosphate dehydrogenase [Deltaproteobacteria bacterium]|nr:NAD(P)-dependent glycerol-3-phosphate dehydrogenase [Deltaproteobacteria bacterium]
MNQTNQTPPLSQPDLKIGVVGAGSWGTALANLLGTKGYPIDFWVFEEEVRFQIRTFRENRIFLPGIPLSERLNPTGDLKQAVTGKDLVLMVVPSHLMRAVSQRMSPDVPDNALIVSASKGIENQTYLTMSGVLAQTLPHIPETRIAALSGPSFAKEVALQSPTVVTVAARDPASAAQVQHVFATPAFRVYTHDDVIGVELGGSVKNVIAIAAGMIDGLGLGLNTRAALITRGLAEIRRLGLKLGANPHTFAGLAGIGDLVLTCTGDLSRNHTVGKKIGEGKSLADILSETRTVAEGVKTAESVYNLSSKLGVDMPISHAVYHILYEGLSPKEAVYQLMTRDLKHEIDDFM